MITSKEQLDRLLIVNLFALALGIIFAIIGTEIHIVSVFSAFVMLVAIVCDIMYPFCKV